MVTTNIGEMFIPTDGRITSQNVLAGPLTGGEVQEIVSPGDASQGNTYQVSTYTLAAFYAGYTSLNVTVISDSGTAGFPYMVEPNETEVMFNKEVGSASFAILPIANNMIYPNPILFKDLKGDAFINPITLTFTNGELCDGKSQIVIDANYGWVTLAPSPLGGGWYQR